MKIRHIIVIASILAILLASAPPGFAEQQTYKVVKGDSLSKIGKMFNTTPEALKALNGLKNDKLIIGQIIKITAEQPDAAVKTVEEPAVEVSTKTAVNTNDSEQPQTQTPQQAQQTQQTQQTQQARKETQTYTVRNGDTLSGIAQSFSIKLSELTAANKISNKNKLKIGQVLTIPGDNKSASAAPAPAAKTPAPTDEISAPAAAQAVNPPATQDSAKTAVNADNSKQPQTQQVQPPQQAQQARKETQTYTVRNGDTLSGIAKSFNLKLNDLTAANKISNKNKLKIGQVLTIPGDNKSASAAPAPAAKTPAPADETSAPAAAVMRLANQTNQTNQKAETASDEDLTARDRLVEAGFNMLGVRYRFGGTSEKTGFDCSGLVKNLFEKFNLTLPRSSRDQYKQGEKVAKEDLQKGDLVFFSSGGKTPTHVGIYMGDNQFLHAASRAKKVVISDLGITWYDLRYIGARRIMELWWGDAKTQSDNSSIDWTHQLLNAWEETQIPLNNAQPEELAVPFQKYDATYNKRFVASAID